MFLTSGPCQTDFTRLVFFSTFQPSLNRLPSIVDRSKRTPRRKEIERKQSLDVEKWLKNKFREGFANMREAFEFKDPKNTGTVRMVFLM